MFGSIPQLSQVFLLAAGYFQQKVFINLWFLAEMGGSECSSHAACVDQHNYNETLWKKFWPGKVLGGWSDFNLTHLQGSLCKSELNGFFIHLCFAYCNADGWSKQLLVAIWKMSSGPNLNHQWRMFPSRCSSSIIPPCTWVHLVALDSFLWDDRLTVLKQHKETLPVYPHIPLHWCTCTGLAWNCPTWL